MARQTRGDWDPATAKKVRVLRKLTRAGAAQRMGVHTRTIYNYEAGVTVPTEMWIVRYARVLRVRPEQFARPRRRASSGR